MVNTDSDGNELHIDDSGTVRRLGLQCADMSVMTAAPQYTEAYPLIPRSAWPKKGGGLRRFMPFRWNQGQQNSCFGHGTGAMFTALWNYTYAETRPVYEFSPTFIYGEANGGRDNGARPDQGIAILQAGVCLRSTVGEGEIYASRYPAKAFEERKRFRADQVFVCNTFDEMVTACLREHAMAPGIFIGNRYRPDANGILPEWDGQEVGGHDIAAIGEYEEVDGKPGLWVLGSWGAEFGLDGWCWHPESYFRGGLPAFGCLVGVGCLSDSQDSTPTPTPNT